MAGCEGRIALVRAHVADWSCQFETRDTIANLDTAERVHVRDDQNHLFAPHGKPYRAREDHAKYRRHRAELAGAYSPVRLDCIGL